MSVRLVATDLDGTALLPGGTDASPRVIAAIAAARAAGIEVAVVTARNWRSAATLAAMLGAEPRPTDAPRRRRPHGCRQRNEGAGAGFAVVDDRGRHRHRDA
ncbi:MAG TPA: HAD hydrolase family protein [Acidimicrobiales bacterium]|nr:HAD hydrolase family protein [Acidimicrobiales bacterium]